MCVLAMALRADARWRLVAAGNRDEVHDRPADPLSRWIDGSGIIAGRDLVAGGSWIGVSEAGRFAVVTNIRGDGARDPAARSRGELVTRALTAADADAPGAYGPFNLIALDADGAHYVGNRPEPVRRELGFGMYGLSNGVADRPWPKTLALKQRLAAWIEADGTHSAPLFDALRDETRFGSQGTADGSPIFVRGARYGTRCSTVVMVDAKGSGLIAERRYDAKGMLNGETQIAFRWPG